MDIAYIDQLANNGGSCLHKASAVSKMILTISIIIFIVMSDSFIKLTAIFILIVILNIINKLPIEKVFHFALYPAFFSLIFAATRFTYSIEAGMVVILKAVDAAMAMILLLTTTPYPEVFAFFRLLLPGVVVDGMFFTYRIFFILLEKIENSLTIIKLRGGLRTYNILFNLRSLAGVIGILFINAFDMSERMYIIYSLRGYQGRIPTESKWFAFKKLDFIPIGISIMIIVMAVIF
ncbi:MAG: CbiQ family ECF transporter T component [Clostridia bacterium]